MSGDVADVGPMARLEELKRDVNAPSMIFQRLTAEEPETLPQIAKSLGLPKGRFVEWFTTQNGALYDAALKVRAADVALQALAISDEQELAVSKQGTEYDPDVARDKLRIETRKWLASRLDRSRFGERAEVKVQVEDSRVPADRETAVLETGRRIAFLLYAAGEAAAAKAGRPLLPAPIEVPKKEEKLVSDPGII